MGSVDLFPYFKRNIEHLRWLPWDGIWEPIEQTSVGFQQFFRLSIGDSSLLHPTLDPAEGAQICGDICVTVVSADH